jgi:3-phytase
VTPASPGAGIEPGAAGAAINKVREFGAFGGGGEIEAVAVDAELGHVYYADESHGIRQYHADPDAPDAAREIAMFGTSGWTGDREGLALYKLPGGEGYLLAVDQIPAGSRCHLFRRGAGHELVRVVETTAVSTDGIEATSRPLGPGFPRGVVAVMNESGKNFYLYRWEDFAP